MNEQESADVVEVKCLAESAVVREPVVTRHADEGNRTEQLVARFAATVIAHPVHKECLMRMHEIHVAGRHCRGRARGMLIHGATGTGKSTIAKEYEQRFPRIDLQERTVVPVLRVELPGQPTAKVIGEAMLDALGDPFSHLGTAEVRMSRVRTLLLACSVDLIIFDEVQHLTDNLDRRNRGIAADTLKNLMNDTGIPCVFVGTPSCRQYFVENQQLGRRCSPKIGIEPFGIKRADDKKTFFQVLKTLDAALPTGKKSALVDGEVAVQLYFASFGLIGILVQLIEAALRKALVEEKQLGREHLRRAFAEVIYPSCPLHRNPFEDNFETTPLTSEGEPFHGLTV